jgi:hypothetical protein
VVGAAVLTVPIIAIPPANMVDRGFIPLVKGKSAFPVFASNTPVGPKRSLIAPSMYASAWNTRGGKMIITTAISARNKRGIAMDRRKQRKPHACPSSTPE